MKQITFEFSNVKKSNGDMINYCRYSFTEKELSDIIIGYLDLDGYSTKLTDGRLIEIKS